MFFHYRPTTQPQTQYYQPSYQAHSFDTPSFGYEESIDPIAYRRLALEHQRKAEEALLRAEEYELEQLHQRRVAAERERARRELVAQEALARAYRGYHCRQQPLYSPRMGSQNLSRRLSMPCTQRRRMAPDEEPARVTLRAPLTKQEERPISDGEVSRFTYQNSIADLVLTVSSVQDSMDFSDILNLLMSGLSSEHPANTKSTPLATPTNPVPRTATVPVTTPFKQNAPRASTPTPSSPHFSSFSSIDAVQAEFDTLKANFSLPDQLDFTNPSGDVPKLAYTSRNAPFLQLESDFTRLLTKLDAIESNGAESVRGARKALVLAIELELAELDRVKVDLWAKQQGSASEKVATVAKGVSPELVDSNQPQEDTVEVVTAAADDDVSAPVEKHEEIVVASSEPVIDRRLSTELTSKDVISETRPIDEVIVSPWDSTLTIRPDTTTHDAVPETTNVNPTIEEDEWHSDSESSVPPSPSSSWPSLPTADGVEDNDVHLIGSPDLEPSQTEVAREDADVSDFVDAVEEAKGPESPVGYKVEVEEASDEESRSDFEML
ncbi:hypothetical protein FRB98_001388 [Tulasnella sp. 332]|nr:hypothetical protein FRB98_001388 [Tulasnella sp. 332]